MREEEWQTSMRGSGPWGSQAPARPDVVRASGEMTSKHSDLADGERETGMGGVSADLPREPSFATPRLIPAPDSPPLSGQLPPVSGGEWGAGVGISWSRVRPFPSFHGRYRKL